MERQPLSLKRKAFLLTLLSPAVPFAAMAEEGKWLPWHVIALSAIVVATLIYLLVQAGDSNNIPYRFESILMIVIARSGYSILRDVWLRGEDWHKALGLTLFVAAGMLLTGAVLALLLDGVEGAFAKRSDKSPKPE